VAYWRKEKAVRAWVLRQKASTPGAAGGVNEDTMLM